MPTATAMPEPQPVVMERPAPGRFYATSQKALNPVDPHLRAEANIAALRIVAQLRDQQRPATPQEQAVIARFSGWGALPHLFDDDPDWDNARAQLRALLDDLHPAAWEAASAATLNSHYSDADIAAVCWDLLRGCGLANHTDGTPIRVFEPGVGSGVFLSTAPKQLNLAWYAVDIDPTAVAIARALHPHATIDQLGLEQVTAPDDTFDLVIGNVPFGNYKLIDPRHNKAGWTVHHHAVYKAVCLTRPGGLIALLCSHFLADSKTSAVRAALDGLADLIGVVRFPNRTFERAAGTHAIEDLLIFRRRPAGALPAAEQALVDGSEPPPSWIETVVRTDNRAQYRINAAMAEMAAPPAHPGLPYLITLGSHGVQRGGHSKTDYWVTLTPADPKQSVRQRAIELFQQVSGEIVRRARHAQVTYQPPPEDVTVGDTDWDSRWREELDQRKEGSIHQTATGGLVRIVGGRAVPYKAPKSGDTAELRQLVDLRDATVAVLAAMVNGDTHRIAAAQRTLGLLYDTYVAQFGPLNRYREQTRPKVDPDTGEVTLVVSRHRPTMGGFRNDPDFWAVLALEVWDEATRTASRAPIFYENVVGHPAAPNPTTVDEAVAVSLNETAGVDPHLIASMLVRPIDQVEAELRAGTAAYENPATGCWEHASVYLAGDVRSKLDIARAAAALDPDRYARNVPALEAVVPEDLGPEDIDLRLGSPMIDTADLVRFCEEILDCTPTIRHLRTLATWEVDDRSVVKHTVKLAAEWGTPRAHALRLLDWALNLKPAQVFDTVLDDGGRERRILNKDETERARGKLEELADRFADWIWEDPDRTDKYVDRYNRVANCWAAPKFDGSHLTLPGLSPAWSMRRHQRDAIWRALVEGGMVMAHSVGLGKTACMVASAVEMRRLGIAAKPLIVVPNHMLEQIAREARQLYPAARMLVCTADDAAKDGRRQFVARCATGNWDLVVMTHSAFGLIPLSARQQANYLARQISVLRRAAADAGKKVKDIEKAIKRKEAKVRRALESGKDQQGMTFEELGVDMVMIDEAHLFKNLDTGTSVTGLQGGQARRAEDLACKIDWLTDRYGDFSKRGPNPAPGLRRRRAILATGTPVANSIAELWVMSRFADYPALSAAGYEVFDAWFGAFGQTVARLEVSPDGGGFRVKDRPARFRNVPELLALWLQVADVRSLKTVQGIDVPAVVGGGRRIVQVEASTGHLRYVAELMRRADLIAAGSPEMRPTLRPVINEEHGGVSIQPVEREDNLLWVVSDGRKAAMHLPLVGSNPDPLGGKVRACAAEVARIYHATKTRGYGTQTAGALQLVFCDLGVNPADRCGECGYPLGQGASDCATCQTVDHVRGRSVYEVLRLECARLGVPYSRVRFMSEASSDAAKANLFAECRDGLVSVLVGSTERMGVGTNVQTRCVALHHLDAPWRPCDIEQREGRIVRQGNQNAEVEVLVYVTAGTFDAFMWQTLETKAGFIEQVTSGQINARTIDDVGETSMGYAEVKAAAAGNPIILEHARAQLALKAARAKAASHQRRTAEIRSMIERLRAERDTIQGSARNARMDAASLRGLDGPPALKVEQPPLADGLLTDLSAQDRLVAWINWWRTSREEGGRDWRFDRKVGRYGHWYVMLGPSTDNPTQDMADAVDPVLKVMTAQTTRMRIGRRDTKLPHAVLWEVRIADAIGDPNGRLEVAEKRLARLKAELDAARAQLDAPFPGQDELDELTATVARLDEAMRSMTNVQTAKPDSYADNPPESIDWDQLERDVMAQTVDELVVDIEAAAAPDPEPEPETDGWEVGVNEFGQLFLFPDLAPAGGVPRRPRRRP